jgi:hypothetical protein
VTAKGVAARQPPHRENRAPDRPVTLDRFSGVGRARRDEAARAGVHRGERELIAANQREDGALSVAPACRGLCVSGHWRAAAGMLPGGTPPGSLAGGL